MNIKTVGVSALAALVLSSQATAAFAAPTGMTSAPAITFATKLTTLHGSLPLFRLTPSAAPTLFVSQAARTLKLGNGGQLGLEDTRLTARDANGVVQALVDGVSGDAEIFPDFTKPTVGAHASISASATASAIFARPDIIPHDVTQARLGDATPLNAAQVSRAADGSQTSSAPQTLFTYVSAQRYAAGLPVTGEGSHATVAVDSSGTIRALVRRWETAAPAGNLAATTTPLQLANAIVAQLQPLQNATTKITVDSVKPVYYDGNARFLQPVYQFFATLHPLIGRAGNDHVVGYIPVGRLVEPLPVLNQRNGSSPLAPNVSPARNVRPAGTSASISLGEYANQDGTMQDMANAYLSGFDSVPAGRYGPAIARTQWYYAEPFEVESAANSYLNAVSIAYTMPHGDWYLNTTLGNYGDLWYINQIGVNGNPGFGAAGGGKLATWIIDSCEVAPSYYDLQVSTGNGGNAFTPWWQVFKGLHRVLGFRTEMLLGMDTMNYDISNDMAIGANANSAFINEIANTNFNQYGTYADYHLNNLQVHYDRASIFYDSRNANESIYSVQGQSASGQLNNVWLGN